MSARALLSALRARGLTFALNADRVAVGGAVERLGDHEREQLKSLKADIVVALRSELELDPEVARRLEVFRAQQAEWVASGRTGIAFLYLPGTAEPERGFCLSGCGLVAEGFRCESCREAVMRVCAEARA